jgi:hypothetical protein
MALEHIRKRTRRYPAGGPDGRATELEAD